MDLFIYLLVGLPLSLLFLYIIFDTVNGDNKWNILYYYCNYDILLWTTRAIWRTGKTIKVDSSYYFNNMIELELETQQMVDESIAYDYGKQFICPNCGEPFDGHKCENCKYTEERWENSNL